MIYDAVHEIFSTLLIDYADIPTYFQPLIILFELLSVYVALKWIMYPITLLLNLLRQLERNVFPKQRKVRSRDLDID
jgi:hypothetical protein